MLDFFPSQARCLGTEIFMLEHSHELDTGSLLCVMIPIFQDGFLTFQHTQKHIQAHSGKLHTHKWRTITFNEVENLFSVFFFFFFFPPFLSITAQSGKKTVTGVQVVTASQVQSIGCRWQAIHPAHNRLLSRSTRGTHFQVAAWWASSKGTNYD